jgi:hypothetical protein
MLSDSVGSGDAAATNVVNGVGAVMFYAGVLRNREKIT